MKEQAQTLSYCSASIILAQAAQLLENASKVASIVIVNRDGTVIAMGVMDGTRPFTVNVAMLKAKQSAITGKLTSVTRDQLDSGDITPQILGIESGSIVPWAGGVPIYSLGYQLGSIGISNLSQEEDERIAIDAVIGVGYETEV